MTYTFVVRPVHVIYDKEHFVDTCIICVQRDSDHATVIHPISEYIVRKHRNDTAATQKNVAGAICRFLNFMRQQGVVDFSDLTVGDVELYLNTLSYEGVSREYLSQTEYNLKQFYYYLAVEKQILPHVSPSEFVHVPNANGESLKLPVDVKRPRKKAVQKVESISEQYIGLLIRTAVRYAPQIAFGFILQFLGGLRAGEVVNLSKSAVRTIGAYGYDGWLVDVSVRVLREDIATGGVKSPGLQRVFPLGKMGADIYKMHMERYTSPSDSDVLFINTRGDAMSDRSYRRYFNVVKERFIDILRHSDDTNDIIYAQYLSEWKWSTHIGRGTYSNMGSKITNNPFELASMRRDKYPLSSMPYIAESDETKRQYREVMQHVIDDTMGKGALLDDYE